MSGLVSTHQFGDRSTGGAGMTQMSPTPALSRAEEPRRDGRQMSHATLLGLGTAVPDLAWPQTRVREAMADIWSLRGRDLGRWRRIADNAGIDRRYGVLPVDEIVPLSTAARMELYEAHAPPIAHCAANRALRQAGVSADAVTDLIVVTCTGFAAPGLDVALTESLGLRRDVRRLTVGFMGCFGAITGLRAAIGACAMDLDAAVLVVCCELCSLHVRSDPGIENQVATALFGDGAAAAVVRGDGAVIACRCADESDGEPALARLGPGATERIPEGRDWMSWRITDAGFAMTLDRRVPRAIHDRIETFIGAVSSQAPASLVVHPGGPDVLDAVEAALGPPDRGIELSRAVLRSFGNMSSGTVLFVLDRLLRAKAPLPGMLLAFGPGLTMEGLPVLAIKRD